MTSRKTTLDAEVTDEGVVTAVIATLGVVDLHGDIVMPNAFGVQQCPISTFNHGSWEPGQNALPIGRATVHEQGDQVIAELRFFMAMHNARDTFEYLKSDLATGRPLAQFSWGFEVDESSPLDLDGGARVRVIEKVTLYEVSPVLKAASIGTGLLSAKGDAQREFEKAVRAYEAREFERAHARSLGLEAERVLNESAGLIA